MKEHVPKEKSIVKSILDYLNSLTCCRAIKFQGTINRAGEPDIFCCHRGRMYLFEVKRPGGKLTPLQAATLEQWQGAWAIAEMVTSVEEVRNVLREAK